jgi:hypothetical protein
MVWSIRKVVVFALVAGVITAGTVSTPTLSAAQSISETAKSTADDVSKWTRRHWNQAKAQWAKQETKWADCNKRATDQKLSGRKSWSFLYGCMTS